MVNMPVRDGTHADLSQCLTMFRRGGQNSVLGARTGEPECDSRIKDQNQDPEKVLEVNPAQSP